MTIEQPVSEMSKEEIIEAVENGEVGDYEGQEAELDKEYDPDNYFKDDLLPEQPEEEKELSGPSENFIEDEMIEEEDPQPASNTELPTDDPYSFIKDNTPFQSDEAIVEGYKNIQALSTKQALKIKELEDQLENEEIEDPEEDLSEIPIGDNISVGQLKELVNELVTESTTKQNMEREQVDFDKHLDTCYNDAMEIEGFADKVDTVYGIINHFPEIVDSHIRNPYKVAFELASNPDIMRLYNRYPDLLKMENGGLDIANQMVASLPSNQIIKTETNEAVKNRIDREIEEINSSVAEPSAGGNIEEKPVSEMSREEVFEAVGTGPDDIS